MLQPIPQGGGWYAVSDGGERRSKGHLDYEALTTLYRAAERLDQVLCERAVQAVPLRRASA